MALTLEVSEKQNELKYKCLDYVPSSEFWRCHNADLWGLTLNVYLNSDKSVYDGMFHISVSHFQCLYIYYWIS